MTTHDGKAQRPSADELVSKLARSCLTNDACCVSAENRRYPSVSQPEHRRDGTLTRAEDSGSTRLLRHMHDPHHIPLVKTHTEPDETFNPAPARHIPQLNLS